MYELVWGHANPTPKVVGRYTINLVLQQMRTNCPIIKTLYYSTSTNSNDSDQINTSTIEAFGNILVVSPRRVQTTRMQALITQEKHLAVY